MVHRNHRKGFTLVELSLAMAFLAVLLITIAILAIRIITIYQSGLALRAVNASGRELIDDFTRSISSAPLDMDGIFFDFRDGSADRRITGSADGLPPSYAALTYKYYFQITGSATINGVTYGANTPLAGGFCTGNYSYLWNTAYSLQNDGGPLGFTYTFINSDGDEETWGSSISNDPDGYDYFKLIRIEDTERSICIGQRKDENGVIAPRQSEFSDPILFAASRPDRDHIDSDYRSLEPIELLGTAEDELALYDFRVFPISLSKITGHMFYSATFILATLRGGVDIFAHGNYCTAEYSETLTTDFNYCAINKFNFATRATGDSGGDVYGDDRRR